MTSLHLFHLYLNLENTHIRPEQTPVSSGQYR